jgi:hypothetical protein
MSSHKDNIQNKKLKELFEKQNSSEVPDIDGFEKEALEGFSMLSSEDDAFELKADLDQKMYKEVFIEDKKSRKLMYWYAAAGLIVAVGFSIYFVQSGLVPENEDLAIKAEPLLKEKVSEEAVVADAAKTENKLSKETEPAGTINTLSVAPKQAQVSTVYKSSQQDNSSGAKVKGAGGMQPVLNPVAASQAEVSAAPPALYADTPDQVVNKQDVLLDEDKRSSEAPSKENVSVKAVTISSKEEESLAKNERRKKQTQQLEGVGSGASQNSPSATSRDDRQEISSRVYYTEGDQALVTYLKTKLKEKNLLQKFDATLYINKNKSVEKVDLKRSYELTKTQQREVIDILKKLDKFNFSSGTENTGLLEYKLVFRP